MAEAMTPESLRELMRDKEAISAAPFAVLSNLADLFNTSPESVSRDLILRALEHREAFGQCQPILDALVREVGLFPYMVEESLSFADTLALEYHRVLDLREPLVFHREQAEIYRHILDGQSVILSAPTSFGKSRIIDAVLAAGKFQNIVVVVPTIALIDETRRRLAAFSDKYKIVTQVSQMPRERNIFVFTAERVNVYEDLPAIDFFVIDEFYKIGASESDPKRTVALNQAFYRLAKAGGQFYLLGPMIRQIPEGLEEQFRCTFYPTTFTTVASDEIRIARGPDELGTLANLVHDLGSDQTLIFCRSPQRVNQVVARLLAEKATPAGKETPASEWLKDEFHPDWMLAAALEASIGMHHGRLPRSIAQYVVRAFNSEELRLLVCTSTLIEGVNTKAKNIIILDDVINRQRYDYFTFNNIRGRAGRMFEHFVGRVFLFHTPPQDELPYVDFPVFTQSDDTPESVLIQMDSEDLSAHSRERIEPLLKQQLLPIELLRKHGSFDPEALLSLAEAVASLSPGDRGLMLWSRYPNREELQITCRLQWDHLVKGPRQGGVFSAAQLVYKLRQLNRIPDIRMRILAELEPGRFAAKSADEAVERVFDFDRRWASFEYPRMLRATSDVVNHILGGRANYGFYASEVENLFRSPFQVALEEFGLPIQITDKLTAYLPRLDTIDEALEEIRELDLSRVSLSQFERTLVEDCREVL